VTREGEWAPLPVQRGARPPLPSAALQRDWNNFASISTCSDIETRPRKWQCEGFRQKDSVWTRGQKMIFIYKINFIGSYVRAHKTLKQYIYTHTHTHAHTHTHTHIQIALTHAYMYICTLTACSVDARPIRLCVLTEITAPSTCLRRLVER
jgi:hypothetical protein